MSRPFVFMDESWINRNAVPTKIWTDGSLEFEPPIPHGKGQRWIMIGAGTREGWIEPTFVMWKGNVLSEDYHSDVFCDWFNRRLLPNVAPSACIVVDRAPYHCVLTEESKPAGAQWTRARLAEWLETHRAADENGALLTKERLLGDPTVVLHGERLWIRKGWTKQALFAKASELRPKPQYLAQQWVDQFNLAHQTDMEFLLLPVAHPVLNHVVCPEAIHASQQSRLHNGVGRAAGQNKDANARAG